MSRITRIAGRNVTFLCCDIQERFRPLIHDFPAVIHTAKKLISASDILGLPLVVTEQYPKALGNTVKELDISKAAFVEEKTKFSMISNNLVSKINSINKMQLRNAAILFGIESHVCVLQTALDLKERDFDVFVVSDGVSSSHKSEIPVAIERMRQSGCVITTSDSILFELACDAKHEKFKLISALVKENMAKGEHNRLLSISSL